MSKKCQGPYKLQNFKILSTFWDTKTHVGKKDKVIDITKEKLNLGSHLHT